MAPLGRHSMSPLHALYQPSNGATNGATSGVSLSFKSLLSSVAAHLPCNLQAKQAFISTNNPTNASMKLCLIVLLLVSLSIESSFGESEVCGENEEYTSCGSSCPDTCESILGPSGVGGRICTMNCVPGCFCKSSFVRDHANKCVHTFNCKNPRDQTPQNTDGNRALAASVPIGWLVSGITLGAVLGRLALSLQ